MKKTITSIIVVLLMLSFSHAFSACETCPSETASVNVEQLINAQIDTLVNALLDEKQNIVIAKVLSRSELKELVFSDGGAFRNEDIDTLLQSGFLMGLKIIKSIKPSEEAVVYSAKIGIGFLGNFDPPHGTLWLVVIGKSKAKAKDKKSAIIDMPDPIRGTLSMDHNLLQVNIESFFDDIKKISESKHIKNTVLDLKTGAGREMLKTLLNRVLLQQESPLMK